MVTIRHGTVACSFARQTLTDKKRPSLPGSHRPALSPRNCLSTSRPLSAPSTNPGNPGHLRSAYGAICCPQVQTQNMTDDVLLVVLVSRIQSGPQSII